VLPEILKALLNKQKYMVQQMINNPNFHNCFIPIHFIVISETKIKLIAHQVSFETGHILDYGPLECDTVWVLDGIQRFGETYFLLLRDRI
jgi:hypothetical protein